MEDSLSVPLPPIPDIGRIITNSLYDDRDDHDDIMTRTLVMCFDGTADQYTGKVGCLGEEEWSAYLTGILEHERCEAVLTLQERRS